MTEKEKNQLIVVGFMICFILIAILTAYTVINTKSIDKLIDKVEVLEGTRNTSAFSTEEGGNGGSGSSGEPITQTGYSTDTFKAIKPSDIKKESKNKTIVVLWARQTCSYCVAYVPLLTEVANKYNVTVRYIDMATIIDINTWIVTDENEYNILANLEGTGEYKNFAASAVEGTPATYFIKNGKIINGILGYVEQSTIEAKFKEVGLK